MNGEIVEVHKFSNDNNTLFCLDCGINWTGKPEIKYLTDEEIKKEKEKRGIDDKFINDRDITHKNLKLLQKAKKKEEKAKKKAAKNVKVKTGKQQDVKKVKIKK